MIYQTENLFQQLDKTLAIHQTTGILVFGQNRTLILLTHLEFIPRILC